MMEGNTQGEAATVAHGSWRASELIHRPVVDVRLGQNLGEVGDIVFDPARRLVSGLLVQGMGREKAVLQAARRAFGGTSGLTYLGVERIISLHADVVTVQAESEPGASSRTSGPVPRLSAFLNFAVISIQGRRLGRFADLLLAPDGRSIVGYLIRAPEGAAAQDVGTEEPNAPAQQVGRPYLQDGSSDGAEAPPQDAAAAPSAALLLIQTDQDVRFGRDLIVVAGRHDGPQREQPAAEGRVTTGASDDIADAPTWQRWESEAPTEQVNR